MPNSFGDFLNTHDPAAEEEKMARQSVLQGTLNDAGQYDPDAYARAMDQAARTGAKPSAVIRNQKLYDEADKRKVQAPAAGTRFADWLMANPDNPKVAHDDIETHQKFEALTNALDSYSLTPSQQQAVMEDRKRISEFNASRSEVGSVLSDSSAFIARSLTKALAGGLDIGRAAYQTIAAPKYWATGEGTTPTERAKAEWEKLTKIWQWSAPDSAIGQILPDVMAYHESGKKTGVSQYLVDPKTGKQFLNPDWTTTGGTWAEPYVPAGGAVDKALTSVFNRNIGHTLGSVPGGVLSFGVAGASAPALFSTEAGLSKFEQARAEGANPFVAGAEGLGSFLLNLGLMTKLPAPTETKTILGTTGQAVGRATILGPAMTAGENLLGRLHGNNRPIFEGSLESTASMLGFEMGGAIPHMVELAGQSKLLKRSPQKFQEFVDHVTKDTVAEDTQIAAEKFNTYFQEKGIDPVEVAKAIGVKNYAEANATGTDLVIPTGKMLAVLGGTEHLKGLEPDLRFRTGDRTLRELEDYQAEFAKQSEANLKTQGEVVKAEVATPELQSIQDIMQKRLEAAGDTPSIAETKAQIHAKVITNLAERVSEDPMALMDKYGWTVSRDMPGAAQPAGSMFQGEPHLGPRVAFSDLTPASQDAIHSSLEKETTAMLADQPGAQAKFDAIPETQSGRVAGGDITRRILDSFNRNPNQGTQAIRFSPDTSKTLHNLARLEYQFKQNAIDKAVSENKRTLVGIGGQGSGKSTLLEKLIKMHGDIFGAALDAPHTVYDNLVHDINMVLAKGGKVTVPFMDTPVDTALRRTFIRSAGDEMRHVSLNDVADAHSEAWKTFNKAMDTFKDNPDVEFVHMEQDPAGGYYESRGKDIVSVMDATDRMDKKKIEDAILKTYISEKEAGHVPADVAREIDLDLQASGNNGTGNGTGITGERPQVGGTVDQTAPAPGQDGRGNVPGDLQQVGQTLYQSAPTFYSALERTVPDLSKIASKDGMVSPDQAKSWLAARQKEGKFKQAELDAVGLPEWLDLQKGKVSVNDVKNFVAQNGVQIQEVMKGESLGDPNIHMEDTKFGEYQLPGGKNYKELLLTLPSFAKQADALATKQWRDYKNKLGVKYGIAPADIQYNDNRLAPEEIKKLDDLIGQMDSAPSIAKRKDFKGQHWDEPNVLAHIRFNERTDAEGKKVLFIEEIQSDWGQKGKKEGFGTKPDPNAQERERLYSELTRVQQEAAQVRQQTREVRLAGGHASEDNLQRSMALTDQAEEIDNKIKALGPKPRTGVVEAPFVTDTKAWVSLSLKRMIRYAAENGFDKVAFVNGDQSADRYDLSKSIDSIQWAQHDDGKFSIGAMKDGSQQIGQDNLTIKEVSDLVGKDIADKIQKASETEIDGELAGVDLKVGGEGMKTFYDKIVPQVAGDVLKKMGGKVGEVQIAKKNVGDVLHGKEVVAENVDKATFEKEWGEGYKFKEKSGESLTQPGFDITPEMKAKVLNEGQTLFQGNDIKRGYLNISENGKLDIHLLEHANESTVFHEFGHGYLEMMGDLALKESAPKQIQDDYASILKWLGVESRDQITTAGHEKFARANEAYLLEGKAPSEGLRGAFQRVKYWMMFYYSKLSDLGVKFNPEIRGVFDRLYASDREIEAAKKNLEPRQLFATPEDMGVSKAEFDIYSKAKAKEIATAKEALQARLIKEFGRERDASWKTDLKNMKQQVAEEVDGLPEFRALRVLTDGQMEDGTPIKLNRQALVDQYGEDVVKALPRRFRHAYALESGMDADSAAELLGFNSGIEMLKSLSEMPERKQFIADTAGQRMKAIHGDMIQDGAVADAAVEALHNDSKAQALLTELRILRKAEREAKPILGKVKAEQKANLKDAATLAAEQAKNAKTEQRATQAEGKAIDAVIPPQGAFRDTARSLVSETPIKDLKPYNYTQAELKASNEAYDLKGKGKFKEAADAKQREILSHFMFLEAMKAKERAGKIDDNARRMLKPGVQSILGKAGFGYQDNANQILQRYEWVPASNETIENRQSLADFIKEQEAEGAVFLIDKSILDESRKINYRSVSLTELEAVHDALNNIEALARLIVERNVDGKKVTYEDQRARLDQETQGRRKALPESGSTLTVKEKVVNEARALLSTLKKPEVVIEKLDARNILGAGREMILDPINKGQVVFEEISKETLEKINELTLLRPKADQTCALDATGVMLPGFDRDLNVRQLLSFLANMGCEENRKAALGGYKLINEDGTINQNLIDGFNKLRASQIKYIQGIWDLYASFQERNFEFQRRMTGIEPKAKTLTPFSVTSVEGEVIHLKGGYFPLDAAENTATNRIQEGSDLSKLFSGGYSGPSTDKGRFVTVSGAEYKVRLNYEHTLTRTLDAMARDIAFREPAWQVNHALKDPKVQKIIQETIGAEYERELLPWLKDTVNGDRVSVEDKNDWFLDKLLKRRTALSAAALGFNIASSISKQLTDPIKAGVLLKSESHYLVSAWAKMRLNPSKIMAEIREMSPEVMRYREDNFNREKRQAIESTTPFDQHTKGLVEAGWAMMGMMDRYNTFPMWLAFYDRAMNKTGRDQALSIKMADRDAQLTFQAGRTKDMSPTFRKKGWLNIFTQFGGEMNTYFNLILHEVDAKNVPGVGIALFGMVAAEAIGAILAGQMPADDDKKGAWLVKNAALAPLSMIPFLRDAASGIQDAMNGGRGDPRYSPVVAPFVKSTKAIISWAKAQEAEDAFHNWKAVLDTADAAGTWIGIPGTAQLLKTGKYVNKVVHGDENPQSFLEFMRGAAFGAPPKQ